MIALLILLFYGAFCHDFNLYVDADGTDDKNDCQNITNKCATLQRALTVTEGLQPSDVVYITVSSDLVVENANPLKSSLQGEINIQASEKNKKLILKGDTVIDFSTDVRRIKDFDVIDYAQETEKLINIVSGGIFGGSLQLNVSSIDVSILNDVDLTLMPSTNEITVRQVTGGTIHLPDEPIRPYFKNMSPSFKGVSFDAFNLVFSGSGNNVEFDGCIFTGMMTFSSGTYNIIGGSASDVAQGSLINAEGGAMIYISETKDEKMNIKNMLCDNLFRIVGGSKLVMTGAKISGCTIRQSIFEVDDKSSLVIRGVSLTENNGLTVFDLKNSTNVTAIETKFGNMNIMQSFMKCVTVPALNVEMKAIAIDPWIKSISCDPKCLINEKSCAAFFETYKEHFYHGPGTKKQKIKWWTWGIPVIVLVLFLIYALVVLCLACLGGIMFGGGYVGFKVKSRKASRGLFENLNTLED